MKERLYDICSKIAPFFVEHRKLEKIKTWSLDIMPNEPFNIKDLVEPNFFYYLNGKEITHEEYTEAVQKESLWSKIQDYVREGPVRPHCYSRHETLIHNQFVRP